MKTTDEWMAETMQPIFDRIAGVSMGKHTPGPWIRHAWDENGGYDCIYSGIRITRGDADASEIVVLSGQDYGEDSWGRTELDRERMEADATLIATAPDLLRAAKQAEEDMAWAESAVPGTNFQAALILLRAAIAKATGAGHG